MKHLMIFTAVFFVCVGHSETLAEKNCTTLKTKLAAANLPLRNLEVPVNYSEPDGAKLNLVYWVRPGAKVPAEFPPLLVIHGGPGAGSARFLDWTPVMRDYPGDVVGVDVRGEGCSSPFVSNQMPEAFVDLRARNIVRDLERLRETLYGDTAWKVFGQSRGSVTGHYYLDMFPTSIESLHLHGYSMGSRASMENYSHTRSFFSARASYRFTLSRPKAAMALRKLREWLDVGPVCFEFAVNEDNGLKHKACGAVALDVLSFDLTNQSNWAAFATKLESLLTEKQEIDGGAATAYLQAKYTTNTYALIFNYIAGTNAQDMGHPSPAVLAEIAKDVYIQEAPICEGRFVANVMLPWYQAQYGSMYSASVDPIDHAKILTFLKNYESALGKKFEYNLYSSENDPVAGPEAYEDERIELGSYVNFQLLLKSAHDGWLTDPAVAQGLMRN